MRLGVEEGAIRLLPSNLVLPAIVDMRSAAAHHRQVLGMIFCNGEVLALRAITCETRKVVQLRVAVLCVRRWF